MNVRNKVGIITSALVVSSLMGMKTLGAQESLRDNLETDIPVGNMFVTGKAGADDFLISAKTEKKSVRGDEKKNTGLLDDTIGGNSKGIEFVTNGHDDMIVNMYSEMKSKERQIEEYNKTYESIKWIKEYGINPEDLSLDRIKLLNTGHKYIGIPYRWGGTTPSGFDCSGFTSYVMREAFGDSIGRTTSTQPYSSRLERISLSEAQPGDLVYKVGQHTGFFIKDTGGNLLILHSPTQGQRLKIGQYDRGVRVYRPKSVDDSKKFTKPEALVEQEKEIAKETESK